VDPDSNQKDKAKKKLKLYDPAATGRIEATPSGNPKYSDSPCLYGKSFIKKSVDGVNLNLIEASYAKATWGKHCAALKSLENFEASYGKKLSWPLSIEVICKYTSWALTEKKLKANTVRSYLSSIKIAHELNHMCYVGNQFVVNAMLKGADNLSLYDNKPNGSRKVMTLALLRILGHQIALCDWCMDSKVTIWCACTTAFFGSFRFGEILPISESEFCKVDTLLWNDIKFRKDGSILIHVKIDKNRNNQGSYIDLFEFKGKNCCPVKSLNDLKSRRSDPNQPVFQFANKRNLCSSKLNVLIQELLFPVIGNYAYDISGHSFRAGLPSAMANNPNLAKDTDIKAWGRWSSNSYLLYTRLKLNQKKSIFDKIVTVLDKI
jgi:hypothetical protein